MGIDNALCEVDGDEIPILDGSAAPFVKLISKAELKKQKAGKEVFSCYQRNRNS